MENQPPFDPRAGMTRRAALRALAGAVVGGGLALTLGACEGSPSTTSSEPTEATESPSAVGTKPNTATASPEPTTNPFEDAIKGAALASTLTYEPGQDSEFMSKPHVEERIDLIADDMEADGIRVLFDPSALLGPEDAPYFDPSTSDDEWLSHVDWEPMDLIIGAAQEKGLKILANFGFWPTPFVEKICNSIEDANSCPPAQQYLGKFAAFCAAAVDRYKFTMAQIGNEDNTVLSNPVPGEKHPEYLKDAAYIAKMHNMARMAIKAVSPDTAVAFTALSNVSSTQEGDGALGPADFLAQAIEAGLVTDAITFNAYNRSDIIEGSTTERTLSQVMNDPKYNKLMPGLSELPIVITEFGQPADPSDSQALEAQRAAIEQALSAGYKTVSVTGRYVYTPFEGPDVSQNAFSLYTQSSEESEKLEPKPAVAAFKNTPVNASR
jgi:hypothetical protein